MGRKEGGVKSSHSVPSAVSRAGKTKNSHPASESCSETSSNQWIRQLLHWPTSPPLGRRSFIASEFPSRKELRRNTQALGGRSISGGESSTQNASEGKWSTARSSSAPCLRTDLACGSERSLPLFSVLSYFTSTEKYGGSITKRLAPTFLRMFY